MNTNATNLFERNQPKYPVDSVNAVKPSYKYFGSVTNSEVSSSLYQTTKSIRIIDDAIIVESVDQKTRAAALNYFDTAKQEASFNSQLHKTDFYKGMTVTFLGIALGLGCGLTAGGIVGAALSILGIRQAINNKSAINSIDMEIGNIEKMMGQWKDPVNDIIAQRRLAGTQGFQYVYRNNLKGKSVHPQEVRELWLNDFSKLINGHQNLRQICDDNLLGSECVSFSWNSPRLPDIEIAGRHFSASSLDMLSEQFRACRTSFNSFETEINNEIGCLKNQKSQLKREIQGIRSRWLYPSECQYTQSKQEAAYLHENALRPFVQEKNLAIDKAKKFYAHIDHPLNEDEIAYNVKLARLCDEEIQHICRQYDSHPAVLNIHRAYERDRRMCDLLYNQSRLAVNSFFDNRLRQLETAFNISIERIEEQRIAGHQSIKNTMDKILDNAANPLSYVNTSTPAIHRNWRIPRVSHEPTWNEVYGQTPCFQSSFSDVISEFSWNLFWSGQGFGYFSTRPTSSWSSFPQERGALPFKQQWFNLHNLQQNPKDSFSQAPRAGMFVREVRVPTPPLRTSSQPVIQVRVPNDTQPARAAAQPTAPPNQEHVVPGTRTGFATSETRGPTPEARGFATTKNR